MTGLQTTSPRRRPTFLNLFVGIQMCACGTDITVTAEQESKEIPTHSRISLSLLNLRDTCFQADILLVVSSCQVPLRHFMRCF